MPGHPNHPSAVSFCQASDLSFSNANLRECLQRVVNSRDIFSCSPKNTVIDCINHARVSHPRINKTGGHTWPRVESRFLTIGHAILGPRDSWIFCMLATSCSNLRPQAEPISWGGKPFANYSFIYCSYIMNTARKKKHMGGDYIEVLLKWGFCMHSWGCNHPNQTPKHAFCVVLIWCFRWVRILNH